MATTTNFGWETPDDTDLVKDGAAAIRTVANSIDTSFVDLKGGTTNQVLAKNSNTDLDFKWVADATGIPATIIDAKGDLIAGTAADTAGRLAVGTNGYVLTADSAETTGIKWAAPASPAFVGCVLSKADQNLSTATATTLSWNNEILDTDGFHDNVTNNSRITIPTGKDGKYLCSVLLNWEGNATGYRQINVFKNGALITTNTQRMRLSGTGTIDQSYSIYNMVFTLAAADYIEIQGLQNSGSTLAVYGGATASNWSMVYLGA